MKKWRNEIMKEKLKRLVSLLMVLSLMMGMFVTPVEVLAASKVALNKTKVTLTVGETVKLKLKNAPAGKTITWSSNKKAVVAVNKNGKVTAKKTGTAKVTAKLNNKSYNCTVIVKKKTDDSNTITLRGTEGKNTNDVKVLAAIIQEQNANYAFLPTDLNSSHYYTWNEMGNLIKINWEECNLKGNLSLQGLDSLISLDCSVNQLSSLDVSKNVALTCLACYENKLSSLNVDKNAALTYLDCSSNQLSSLNVSKNIELTYLDCGGNGAQLSSLDVGKNIELTYLDCRDNWLSSLDVSKNIKLTYLDCGNNWLSSLDVSKNIELTHLDCSGNRLSSLDVSGCTELDWLNCDDNVTVIR